MQHEFYVSFSIHGTNTFITANKKVEVSKTTYSNEEPITIDRLKFTTTRPREGNSLRGATKLNTTELMSGTRPLSDPKAIHEFFMKLRSLKWNVEAGKFEKKHGITPVVVQEPAVTETKTAEAPAATTQEPTATLSTTQDTVHPPQVDDPNLPSQAEHEATLAETSCTSTNEVEQPAVATDTPPPAPAPKKEKVPYVAPLGARQQRCLEALKMFSSFPVAFDSLHKNVSGIAPKELKEVLRALESRKMITVGKDAAGQINEVLTLV